MIHLSTLFYTVLTGALFFLGPALSAIAIRRSLPISRQLLLLGLCIVYGLLPILIALVGYGLAESYGCEADITIYECPGNPALGDWVTTMTFAPWGAFITIPSAGLGVIGFLISLSLQAKRSRTEGQSVDRPTPGFYRSRRHKVIAGLCAALAQQWGVSLLLIRVAAIALTIISGLGVPLYLWLWLAFPLEPSAT